MSIKSMFPFAGVQLELARLEQHFPALFASRGGHVTQLFPASGMGAEVVSALSKPRLLDMVELPPCFPFPLAGSKGQKGSRTEEPGSLHYHMEENHSALALPLHF